MSHFRKLSQTIWHCQYHVVWVPKYRLRILNGDVAKEDERCIRAFTERLEAEVVELNIQTDHVHLLVMIPLNILGINIAPFSLQSLENALLYSARNIPALISTIPAIAPLA